METCFVSHSDVWLLTCSVSLNGIVMFHFHVFSLTSVRICDPSVCVFGVNQQEPHNNEKDLINLSTECLIREFKMSNFPF